MRTKKEFLEVVGDALDETRDKMAAYWTRYDEQSAIVNFALGLFTGIVSRRMRGDLDPDPDPIQAATHSPNAAPPGAQEPKP